METNVKKQLAFLGKRIKDRVTGFEGVCDTIFFDLYGCIQACINPGVDESGKKKDGMWIDISRIIVTDHNRVMEPPNYDYGDISEGFHGPADKPPMNRR